MKAICIPAFSRAELFYETLISVATAHKEDWCEYVSIEGGAIPTITQALTRVGSVRKVWKNGIHLGCSLNSFTVCCKAISDGAEAILFMDDDVLLSPDALDLCDWYLKREHGPNDAGIALCRKDGNDPTQPELISDKDTWMGHLGQGWCFTRQMWFDFVLRNWWSYDTTKPNWPDCHDWALCWAAQQQGKVIYRPRFARAKHNGAVGFHGPGLGVFPDKIATGTDYNYKLE